MTRRLWLLILIVYILVFLGMLSRNGRLLSLAIPFFIYILAAFLSNPPEAPTLEVKRLLSSNTLTKDKTSQVDVQIINRSAQSIEVLVEDPIAASLELVDGEPRAMGLLPPQGRLELSYTLRGRRGYYPFQPIRVTCLDESGLLQRRMSYPVMTRLIILPEVWRLHQIPIQPLRTHEYSGLIPSRQAGAGINFFGARGYQMGDPMRWINWKKTARHPEQLYITEFEQERIADVGLILDARDESNVVFPDDSLFDHAVVATASLADSFLQYGNRVGLLIYGRGSESTFPGYGKLQREKILRALAWAETGENMVLEDLSYLPTKFFPPHSQIILVSPLLKDDLPVLVRLRANGYQVVVISPDPVEYEASRLKMDGTSRLAIRLAQVERDLLIHRLLRMGVAVVDWQVSHSLDQTIQNNLGHLAANFATRRFSLG